MTPALGVQETAAKPSYALKLPPPVDRRDTTTYVGPGPGLRRTRKVRADGLSIADAGNLHDLYVRDRPSLGGAIDLEPPKLHSLRKLSCSPNHESDEAT